MENDRSQRGSNDYTAHDKNTRERDGSDRNAHAERKPRYNNDERGERRPFRAARPSRQGYEQRQDGERRPRFERDGERPQRPRNNFSDRDGKPRSNYGDRDRKPRPEGGYENRGDRSARPFRPENGDRKPRFERDGERRPRFERDGERKPRFERDGERRPRFERDGERKPRFERDGERRPRFERDGERKPRFERDGERAPRFERDGERRPRFERDGERRPRFERDGERRPRFERDGERAPRFERDGERRPRFERDGERRPRFERDGERRPRFERDGERAPRFERDGERRPRFERDGERRPRFEPAHENEQNQPMTAQTGSEILKETGYTEFGYAYSNTTAAGLHGSAQYDGQEPHAGGEREYAAQGFEGSPSYDNEGHAENRNQDGGAEQSYPPRAYDQNRPAFEEGRQRFSREDRDRKRPMKRPPLRETIMNMDKDLLKMLARRCNILDRMRSKAGQMAPKEEKELRASWERAATQMTRDPRIVHQLFALMQEIIFSAKPEAGAAKRTGFNLAPPQLPVEISMFAPLASRRSRLFLALAGASGSPCSMSPSLLDDATIECIKMFNQCATSLAWDDKGTLISRAGGGLSLPDKVIYVGDDILNFFLLLGHYVSQNTRAKFTGESSLKEADLTAVRSFLPQLGARLSNVMPNGSGFPIRLECSGIFEDQISLPADIPADMILGLFLAAPFWEKAISFEMRARGDAQAIIEEALSVLEPCGAQVRRDGSLVHFVPCPIKTPSEPNLGMDLPLAAYLLAFPLTVGGTVQLNGVWPDCTPAKEIEALLTHFGLEVTQNAQGISTSHAPIEPLKFSAYGSSKRYELAQEALAENTSADEETSVENTSVAEKLSTEHMETATPDATEEVLGTETTLPAEEQSLDQASALVDSVEESMEDTLEQDVEEMLETMTLPDLALYKDTRFAPLMATCIYLAALRKKHVILPVHAPLEDMESFFNHLGFEYTEEESEERALVPSSERYDSNAVWTAPSPAWAMAYALCAAARPHIKLSNPGIMSNLYPQFWNLYNALPSFDIKKNVTENEHEKPVRRRIIAADQERIGSGDSNNRDDA